MPKATAKSAKPATKAKAPADAAKLRRILVGAGIAVLILCTMAAGYLIAYAETMRGAQHPRGDKANQDLWRQEPAAECPGETIRARWCELSKAQLAAAEDGALQPGHRTYTAFAVWDGATHNVGARKLRTNWVPLVLP